MASTSPSSQPPRPLASSAPSFGAHPTKCQDHDPTRPRKQLQTSAAGILLSSPRCAGYAKVHISKSIFILASNLRSFTSLSSQLATSSHIFTPTSILRAHHESPRVAVPDLGHGPIRNYPKDVGTHQRTQSSHTATHLLTSLWLEIQAPCQRPLRLNKRPSVKQSHR
jgi:hypothetical protein